MNEFGTVNAEIIDSNNDMSIAKLALAGLNRPVIYHGSNTEYEVICGEGTVEIDFEVKELRPGSRFVVGMGTPYQDEAHTPRLIMLATCKPPFDPGKIEYLA